MRLLLLTLIDVLGAVCCVSLIRRAVYCVHLVIDEMAVLFVQVGLAFLLRVVFHNSAIHVFLGPMIQRIMIRELAKF
jgi:hypothetical protein